jgi:magnesium-transporting ATPase (P-type)
MEKRATQIMSTQRQRGGDQPWHSLTSEASLAALSSGRSGLEAAEAEGRIAEFGPNRLAPPRRRGPWLRLVLQFHNVLLYVLLPAAVLTAMIQVWVDTAVIVGVVVINAVVGFLQEGKAERALEAVRSMLSHTATVIQGGERVTLSAEELFGDKRHKRVCIASDNVPSVNFRGEIS